MLVISFSFAGDVWYLNSGQKVVIESPDYPQNYPVKVDKAWNFQTLKGHGFVVNFKNFSLEKNWDYMSLGSGLEPNSSSRLAAFTGDDVPEVYSIFYDTMWMRFTSDLSRTSQGFRVEVTAMRGNSDLSNLMFVW